MDLGSLTVDCPACGMSLTVELTCDGMRQLDDRSVIVDIEPILPTHLCPGGPDGGGELIPLPVAA